MQKSENIKQNDGNILIVDDDEFILNLIIKNLSAHNFSLTTAINGFEALDYLEAKGNNYDLVILDIMMPKLSGYDVARKIREQYSLFELPILMVTAKNKITDIVKGFELGANDYIAKPFNNSELLARTKTLARLRKLTISNNVLNSALELKNQFINMTIHDLRNPLSVINGVIDLLKTEVDFNDEQVELVELIETSNSLMLNLVNELLETAKIESGKITLVKKMIDMNNAIEQSISKFVSNAKNKGQTIKFQKNFAFDVNIFADSLRLQQILDNLISNAIKYSPIGETITISVNCNENQSNFKYVRVSVKDNGPGLTDFDLQRVFGSFQKLSAQPTGGESSSGLGLAIVKQLVQLHDGKIWVETETGQGASFIFEIPAYNQKQNVDDFLAEE